MMLPGSSEHHRLVSPWPETAHKSRRKGKFGCDLLLFLLTVVVGEGNKLLLVVLLSLAGGHDVDGVSKGSIGSSWTTQGVFPERNRQEMDGERKDRCRRSKEKERKLGGGKDER